MTLAHIHRRNKGCKVVRPVTILLWLTTFALAADVSGKWDGTLEFKGEDGQAQTVPAHADLKQQNATLVGTVWKEDGQRVALVVFDSFEIGFKPILVKIRSRMKPGLSNYNRDK